MKGPTETRDPALDGHIWRDCNAAGLKHLWRFNHKLTDGTTYWLCVRGSCSVGTRTASPDVRPKAVLR